MNRQGDALSLQALGQLWTSITPRRSWQRTGIPPRQKQKGREEDVQVHSACTTEYPGGAFAAFCIQSLQDK